MKSGWKVLTHNLCSPLQGGPPICDGMLPVTLPPVPLDTSVAECAGGWNYCAEPHTALRIAGLWPNGRPSRLFFVEAATDAIERGDKRRASSLTLLREATDDELDVVLLALSRPFGAHAQFMAEEQRAWRLALRRPRRDVAVVEQSLREALRTRGLAWSLQRDEAAWAARAARAAWDARDARAALTVAYASVCGWIAEDRAFLTAGIREAYANGLGLAVPTQAGVLGWAMDA